MTGPNADIELLSGLATVNLTTSRLLLHALNTPDGAPPADLRSLGRDLVSLAGQLTVLGVHLAQRPGGGVTP